MIQKEQCQDDDEEKQGERVVYKWRETLLSSLSYLFP